VQNDPLNKGVWYTSKGGDVYAIVTKWPAFTKIQLGAFSVSTLSENAVVSLLGYDHPLELSRGQNDVTIGLPQLTPTDKPKYAMVLKISDPHASSASE